MAKVFITRRIPEEAIELLKNAPEVAEVKVNPDNRVLTRQGRQARSSENGSLIVANA